MKKNPNLLSKYVVMIDPTEREFVKLSLELAHRAKTYARANGITQKQIADRIGKEESEVSRWMSGMHNITLKNIARLNVALGYRLVRFDAPLTIKMNPAANNQEITMRPVHIVKGWSEDKSPKVKLAS
jgi:transcriptional regulator with XRE-family HTH domain